MLPFLMACSGLRYFHSGHPPCFCQFREIEQGVRLQSPAATCTTPPGVLPVKPVPPGGAVGPHGGTRHPALPAAGQVTRPSPPTPLSPVSLCHQLFNIYPRLGALLGLHRPVLQKIEEVRSILTTLLEARRPPASGGGPVHSYVDALIQQGQVRRDPPPPRPLEVAPGPHSRRGPCWSCTRLLCVLAGGIFEPRSPL